jgi:two-component system, cell cycle sensor histidine kinase and response regulator CckA
MEQIGIELRRCEIQGSLQNHSQIKILPAFSVDGRLRLREADVDEVARSLQDVLPQHVEGDINVTITLLEKNLKILADMALMKEALAHLVRNVLDVMPCCGKFSLTINQLNFEIESLLNADDSLIGACTFISLAGGGADGGVDEKMKEKIFEPFFTTKTVGNGLRLTIAYRIIKQHHGRIRGESRAGQGTEVNLYLPLTKLEIVNMMSIPAG